MIIIVMVMNMPMMRLLKTTMIKIIIIIEVIIKIM